MGLRKKVDNFTFKNFGVRTIKGDYFACYPKEKIIVIPTKAEDISNKSFMDNYNSTYGESKFDEFVISVLHEVGHAMFTQPKETEKMYKQRVKMVECGLADQADYFAIPQEQMASDFAYIWLKCNKKKAKKFWKKIKKDLNKLGYGS